MARPQIYTANSPRHKADKSVPSAGKARIEWIDIAKGVGIVLVSFGHLRNGDGQSVWLPALAGLISAIYLFHMPLFYLLGGLTFSMRGGFKSFLIRKVKTLLVPYYIFPLYFLVKPFAILLIPSLRETFQMDHDYEIAHQFYDVLIVANGLWFLMAFFVGEVIMYGLVALTGQKKNALIAIGTLLTVGSVYRSAYLSDLQLSFHLLTGVEVAGFMCFGLVLRCWFKGIARKQDLWMCLAELILFDMIAVAVVENNVPNIIRWSALSVAAFLGSVVIIFLCITSQTNKLFADTGRDSLVYYALNALTLNVVKIGIFRALHIDATTWPFMFQIRRGRDRSYYICTRVALYRKSIHTTLYVVGNRETDEECTMTYINGLMHGASKG